MTDGWLDPARYERHEVLGCTGPGTADLSFPDRFTGHITVSRPGSMDAVLALFRSKPCYAPQFVYDPASRRFAQLIPWDWSGAALEGGGCEGTETNRAGRNVQLEICARVEDVPDLPDSTYIDIAHLIADLVRDGWDGDWHNVPDYQSMTGTTATYDAPQRLHGQAWHDFNGLGAHIICPCNAHHDWTSEFQAHRLPALIEADLNGNPGQPVDPPPVVVPPVDPPPVAPQPEFVQIGMEGGIVEFGQQLLIGLGYSVSGDVPGVFGEGTEAAVKQLQADGGITSDGIIGPVTVREIARRYSVAVPPSGPTPWSGRYLLVQSPMLDGDDVLAVQSRLSALGFDPGAIDSVYGDDTANAVYNFQATHGLKADRVVGPNTWAALGV